MKLSKRLQAIENVIDKDYEHIWDCCCDHGFLGMSLIAKQIAPHIHFVDCVESIIDNLNSVLDQTFNGVKTQTVWQTYMLDVLELPLWRIEEHSPQLIIIAGVGGELCSSIVRTISERYPDHYLDFLLCPVRDQYQLRADLQKVGFFVQQEQLVKENNRFYEVILVNQLNKKRNSSYISLMPVGSLLWQAKSGSDQILLKEYVVRVINHYQKHLKGLSPNSSYHQYVKKIVKEYDEISCFLDLKFNE